MDDSLKPKLVCDQVFDRLKTAAKAVLRDFAEPASILITVAWNSGQNDFPFGALVTPDNNVSMATILMQLEQLHKSLRRLTGDMLLQSLANYKQAATELETRIVELRKSAEAAEQKSGRPLGPNAD